MSYKRREILKGAMLLGLIVIAIINLPITLVLLLVYLLIRIFN